MIEKADPNDARPQVIIEKLNEVIEWINQFIELNEDEDDSVVEDAEPSHVNEADD
jgi:hypothetical protein